MAEKNQWSQVFQGKYFLHMDYRDSGSLKTPAARADANAVLMDISVFPYPQRETIPNDFEFPPNSLEGQETSGILYQLLAIETNCLKLSEILKNVSVATVEAKFDCLARYASDLNFRQYVDGSLEAAIDASRYQQIAVRGVSNDPDQRKVDDLDPEDLSNVSSMFDSYRMTGYYSALNEVVRIARQAQASSQSAEEKVAQLQTQVKETQERIDQLTTQATDAVKKASDAIGKANDAVKKAHDATGKANDAVNEANEAKIQVQETTQSAEEKAAQLQTQAEETQERIDQLTTQAMEAVKKANDAWKEIQQTTKQATDATQKANDAWNEVQKTTEEAKNLIPNMLTILGIFVAIIIAVVGCYLSVLLNAHTENPATISLATCLVMGHILVNIIFLLLYFISKLTNKQISCYCHKANMANCDTCTECCTWFSRMWIRYPVIVVLNSAFVIGYYILFSSQVALSIYPKAWFLCWLRALPKWAGGLIIAALVVVLIVVLFILIRTLNKIGTRTGDQDSVAPEDTAPNGGTDSTPTKDGEPRAPAGVHRGEDK